MSLVSSAQASAYNAAGGILEQHARGQAVAYPLVAAELAPRL